MRKNFLFILLFSFSSIFSFTQEKSTAKLQISQISEQKNTTETNEISPEQQEKKQTQKEIKEFIDHHLLDAHSFNITETSGGHHIGFSLPVIFYDKENGFHAFMSSKFENGEKIVEKDGNYYKLFQEKIFKTDEKGTIILNEKGHPENEKVIDFSITKGVFSMLFVSFLMLLFFAGMAKKYKKNPLPSGVGRFLEPIIVFVRDDIAIPNIGYKYKRYLGYLLTIFFFILFLNILGLIPFGINVTGNITFTFFLALCTYLIVQFSGNKDYWKHIFWMPGVPVPMKIIMLPIEILGTLTKPFALMIRLFANMTAGHIVVMSLIGLIFVYKNWIGGVSFSLLTLMIYVLEVLVAFLQAYIFTLLSALFIGMAVQEHEHSH